MSEPTCGTYGHPIPCYCIAPAVPVGVNFADAKSVQPAAEETDDYSGEDEFGSESWHDAPAVPVVQPEPGDRPMIYEAIHGEQDMNADDLHIIDDDPEQSWEQIASDYGIAALKAVQDAVAAAVAAVRADRDETIESLVSALERTRNNFRLAVQGKPVRDMAETLAEVDAALLKASS